MNGMKVESRVQSVLTSLPPAELPIALSTKGSAVQYRSQRSRKIAVIRDHYRLVGSLG